MDSRTAMMATFIVAPPLECSREPVFLSYRPVRCRGEPQRGAQTLPTERIPHRGRLLRCGISTRPVTAVGHFRQIGTLPTLTGCPLRSESGQAHACLDMSASCRLCSLIPGFGVKLSA